MALVDAVFPHSLITWLFREYFLLLVPMKKPPDNPAGHGEAWVNHRENYFRWRSAFFYAMDGTPQVRPRIKKSFGTSIAKPVTATVGSHVDWP